ncbi:uncharacterized protein LOC122872303 isoform X2 [Siniperca chuatsi]|uniref:uncharacterized protein LOC122872303 isoform X2 n=1 Tax=Siniperca chuatsi TaxID=119488 RepID=UPI001CE13977|nr:uncharacterized protein LOC122872303 isoform X2 [Siniperca chuatsi]
MSVAAAAGAAAAACVARWTNAAPVSTAAAAHRRSPPFTALTSRFQGIISRCHRVLEGERRTERKPEHEKYRGPQPKFKDFLTSHQPNSVKFDSSPKNTSCSKPHTCNSSTNQALQYINPGLSSTHHQIVVFNPCATLPASLAWFQLHSHTYLRTWTLAIPHQPTAPLSPLGLRPLASFPQSYQNSGELYNKSPLSLTHLSVSESAFESAFVNYNNPK